MWNGLNSKSKTRIGHIINNSVLDMDQKACENLMATVLADKIKEDKTKALKAEERFI